MPWSCRILLRHHQTEKLQRHMHCSDLMPKVYAKVRKSAQFETFAQNGLKFPSELCFGIMNLTKDSYLLNSKVAKMRQESVLFSTVLRYSTCLCFFFFFFICVLFFANVFLHFFAIHDFAPDFLQKCKI